MKVRRLPMEGIWRIYAACTDRGDCPLEAFFENLGPDFHSSVNGMLALLDRKLPL